MDIYRRYRRLAYYLKHRYVTLNNIVIAIAAVITIAWAWGSVSMMQRNYQLQRKLDDKQRELTLTELEVQTLEYQKRYYGSAEYQELSARENLGLANPGEKLLNLPPNSAWAKQYGKTAARSDAAVRVKPSNAEQWIDFLLGNNASQDE
jgi:cell division protein FtsB